MSLLKKTLYYLLLLCATVLIAVTVASLVYESSLWYFKVLDFPRLSVLVALVMCLMLFAFRTEKWGGQRLAAYGRTTIGDDYSGLCALPLHAPGDVLGSRR